VSPRRTYRLPSAPPRPVETFPSSSLSADSFQPWRTNNVERLFARAFGEAVCAGLRERPVTQVFVFLRQTVERFFSTDIHCPNYSLLRWQPRVPAISSAAIPSRPGIERAEQQDILRTTADAFLWAKGLSDPTLAKNAVRARRCRQIVDFHQQCAEILTNLVVNLS